MPTLPEKVVEPQTQQPVAKELTGCDKWRGLVSKYGWDTNIVMAIMEAESSCDTTRIGDTKPINGVLAFSCGLMQVRTLSPWRGTCEQLQDPAFNIDIAYKVYQGQGYKAWSVFNSGAYKQYLR